MDNRHYNNELLKRWREEAGISQIELAERLDVHRVTVIRAESGQVTSYDVLTRIAALFGKPVVALLNPNPDVSTKADSVAA